MGRRTFDSLRDNFGGPLPNRVNVVVSRTQGGPAPEGTERDGARWFAALPDALDFAARRAPGEVFLLGGADIFRLALTELAPPPQRLVVTWVPEVPAREGDTFFPFLPPEPWIRARYREAQRWKDSTGALDFVVYERDGARAGT
jgi:dihydrofolate reductase